MVSRLLPNVRIPQVILFALALLGTAGAAGRPAPEDASGAVAPSNTTRARQLAADVHEFATAPGMSRAKREKRIATAVRTATVAATAYRSDSGEILSVATELAAAAANAAPAYTEVIVNAAALSPGVSRIDGATGAVRAAALAGARGGKQKSGVKAARAAPHSAPAPRTVESEEPPPAYAEPAPRVASNSARHAETAELPDDPESGAKDLARREGAPVSDQRFAITLTTDLGVRYDDNVFLASVNKVNDTIFSEVPGIALRWGENALSGGDLSFAESFNQYHHNTSPNVALANAHFDAAYQGATTSGKIGGSYQQLDQSSVDVLTTGANPRIRTNIGSAGFSFEADPWAKIGFRLGGNYTNTVYPNGGLIGNMQIGVPVDLLYRVTPKTSLSLGYSYGTQRPDGEGDDSQDHYFNVGANGEFTAKLSGSVNVGYQTRHVGDNPPDHILAFNGSLNYELTPKTGMTLTMNRDFNASALGATTTNTAFRLGFNTEFSAQWKMSAKVSYLINDYGPTVFRTDATVVTERLDHLWEADLTATYLFTDWFSTSASYNFRKNSSTEPVAEFTSNIMALSMGLRY